VSQPQHTPVAAGSDRSHRDDLELSVEQLAKRSERGPVADLARLLWSEVAGASPDEPILAHQQESPAGTQQGCHAVDEASMVSHM
jgi:hypothetical protein